MDIWVPEQREPTGCRVAAGTEIGGALFLKNTGGYMWREFYYIVRPPITSEANMASIRI